MDAQLKRGLLDACILVALEAGESYGYKIIEDTRYIIEISESTLYPILKRLEAGGLLAGTSREYNGRLRRYYRITLLGRGRLAEMRRELQDVNRISEYIMSPGNRGLYG